VFFKGKFDCIELSRLKQNLTIFDRDDRDQNLAVFSLVGSGQNSVEFNRVGLD